MPPTGRALSTSRQLLVAKEVARHSRTFAVQNYDLQLEAGEDRWREGAALLLSFSALENLSDSRTLPHPFPRKALGTNGGGLP
jgi:hypothetical protein